MPPEGFSLNLDSTVFQRSGDTGSTRGAATFLTEALTIMPAHWKLRTVRADSGLFENALLTFLEARGIPLHRRRPPHPDRQTPSRRTRHLDPY